MPETGRKVSHTSHLFCLCFIQMHKSHICIHMCGQESYSLGRGGSRRMEKREKGEGMGMNKVKGI